MHGWRQQQNPREIYCIVLYYFILIQKTLTALGTVTFLSVSYYHAYNKNLLSILLE